MSRRVSLFIPFLNRPDLLEKAVASTEGVEDLDVAVINNSEMDIGECGAYVYTPPVPLSFTQSQNWMLKMARNTEDDFYLWMHSDAETNPEALAKLIDMARAEKRNWGVIYTFYDILCAYRTEAFEKIGGYDTAFTDYFSDNDVHHRLKLTGYELLESHIETKHVGSATINSDPYLRVLHQIKFPMARALYQAKWGGNPDFERFLVPYNGMAGNGV